MGSLLLDSQDVFHRLQDALVSTPKAVAGANAHGDWCLKGCSLEFCTCCLSSACSMQSPCGHTDNSIHAHYRA